MRHLYMGVWMIAWWMGMASSCQIAGTRPAESPSEGTDSTALSIPALPIQEVSTIEAVVHPFEQEYQLNGIIRAHEQVELRSEISGWVRDFDIREGTSVHSGETVIRLDDTDLQYDIAGHKVALQQAENDRDERRMLVSGGDYGSDSLLSPQQLQYIDIASGYHQARHTLEVGAHQLTKTMISSPISGVIADIQIKNDQWLNASEPIARVINPMSFEAELNLLESVALQLRIGQNIIISAINKPDLSVTATVSIINPVVDENGLVMIKAKLESGHRQFYEGMHIKAIIKTFTEPLVVIPKEALVLRSSKEVVFTYAPQDNLAKWNYVTVAYENSTHIGISEGLQPGDAVIVEGQLNLSHDARVQLSLSQQD